MEPAQKDEIYKQLKSFLYTIVDNDSYDNVCFTYRTSNKLAGQHYKIAMNKNLSEELKTFLLCHEAGHIICRHVATRTTLDYEFTERKIRAVYERLKPLFDGQDIEDMYDIFEDYIFNMLNDWEVNTRFFTPEEVEYWDSLYPEECCAGGEVHHLLPQECGYPPGLTANEYLLLILQNPEQWFINMAANGMDMKNKNRKHKNGTEGGCNTNQSSSGEGSDDANMQNHNKQNRQKSKDKQRQNQKNQNGQGGGQQNQQQQNQNGNGQNQQQNGQPQVQQKDGTDAQNQAAANEQHEQNWHDGKHEDQSGGSSGGQQNAQQKDSDKSNGKSGKGSSEEQKENGQQNDSQSGGSSGKQELGEDSQNAGTSGNSDDQNNGDKEDGQQSGGGNGSEDEQQSDENSQTANGSSEGEDGDSENDAMGSSDGDEESDGKSLGTEGDSEEKSGSEEGDGTDGESGSEGDGEGSEGDEEEQPKLTKEQLKELIDKMVQKMVSDYQRTQEATAAEAKAKQHDMDAGYSRGNGGGSGVALRDEVTNWSDYDGLEKQIRELLVSKCSTTTKRDLLYNYNRGRFSSDVCIPRYRTETTYDEVPMTVLLDVSGSISQSDILGFCNIFKNVAKSMSKKCTIVLWDTDLRAIFDSNDEVKPISGGGTDIGKGIKYVNDNMQPADIGSLFVVSDCCDDLEDWMDSYKGTKYCVCWTDNDTIRRYTGSLYDDWMAEWEKVLVKN